MKNFLLCLVLSTSSFLVHANPEAELFMAVYTGNTRFMKEIIQSLGTVNIRNSQGATPLHMAAQNGNGDIVKILLDNGASPNVQTFDKNITPLFLAAQNGHARCIELLFGAGADPYLVTFDHNNPLLIATLNGHTEAVHTLISHLPRFYLNRPNEMDGASALFIATANRHAEIVYLLLKAGADRYLSDRNGVTPLQIAIHLKYWELLPIFETTSYP